MNEIHFVCEALPRTSRFVDDVMAGTTGVIELEDVRSRCAVPLMSSAPWLVDADGGSISKLPSYPLWSSVTNKSFVGEAQAMEDHHAA